MNINATLLGQFVLLMAITTSLILIVKSNESKWLIVLNFILNIMQPIGIIYFLYLMSKTDKNSNTPKIK
ncbi:hypothetical protein CXF83_15035 [Shewanella sp. Choline-02u-19]|nr:hypothetical protein CXF83_15035 [Shewanella sp. Choline-02u-19]